MEMIKVKANQSKRTFTIRKYIDDRLFAKYRTIKMDKGEFEVCEYNTQNDWNRFLKSNDYYKI